MGLETMDSQWVFWARILISWGINARLYTIKSSTFPPLKPSPRHQAPTCIAGSDLEWKMMSLYN